MSILHVVTSLVRNDNIRERLQREIITKRCRKARQGWFGHDKRRDQDYARIQTLLQLQLGTVRPRTRGLCAAGEKKKTKPEMDGQCQPRHESQKMKYMNMNWLDENCVCHKDPATKWEKQEEDVNL